MAPIAVQQRQRLFREGPSTFLGRHPDVEVVGTARTAGDLARLCDDHRPDVALLEVEVADWDPCHLAPALRARHPDLRLIGLPAGRDPAQVRRAHRSRIESVLSPSCGSDVVLAAVRGAKASGGVIPLARGSEPGEVLGPRLTERERQVLELIGAGATSKETSARLGISRKTGGELQAADLRRAGRPEPGARRCPGDAARHAVRRLPHRCPVREQTRLFRKLGVLNRAQAVGRAHSLSLLGDETATNHSSSTSNA